MLQPTGSVYLDTPTASSRRTYRRAKALDPRAVLAGLLTVLGLLGLSAALVAIGLQIVVLDPSTVAEGVDRALDDPAARAELQAEIADAIAEGFVGPELTEIAAAYGLDVGAEAARVSGPVIDDPEFRAALRDLADDLHARALLDPSTATPDAAPISAAVRAVLERESPTLASIIPPGVTLWTLEDASVPDLTAPVDLLERLGDFGLVAGLAVFAAIAVHPRRHRVGTWCGSWALGSAMIAAVAAVGLPYLAGGLTGWTAVEVGVRAESLRLLAPAAVGGVIGAAILTVSSTAARRDARRIAREGREAALGLDEPLLWHQPATPSLDLAARGLVDVNHPLTNI